MCIYCGTSQYRKIYEHHYGPIPVDPDFGRRYDIHHKDGNHTNNNPENLIAVSRKEHYRIHYEQGDWAACLRMSGGLLLDQSEIDQLVVDFWTDERRAQMSRLQKERMNDPEHLKRLCTPQRRERARQSHLDIWQNNPERREQYAQAILERMSNKQWKQKWMESVTNESYREKQRQIRKEKLSDPVLLATISENSKRAWKNSKMKEDHIKRLQESHSDPIQKAKRMQGLSNKLQDPEFRKDLSNLQKQRMENNPALKEAGSKRFSQLNKERNSQEHSCPYCDRIGKGPGFVNHIRACQKKMGIS